MEEDCAETPRQDDITYCQNFNKSHSQQCFVVNPFKSGAGERGGPFHCSNKSHAGYKRAEHGECSETWNSNTTELKQPRLQRWRKPRLNWRCISLSQTSTVLFYSSNVSEVFLELSSKGLYLSLPKGKNRCLVFAFFIKRRWN